MRTADDYNLLCRLGTGIGIMADSQKSCQSEREVANNLQNCQRHEILSINDDRRANETRDTRVPTG